MPYVPQDPATVDWKKLTHYCRKMVRTYFHWCPENRDDLVQEILICMHRYSIFPPLSQKQADIFASLAARRVLGKKTLYRKKFKHCSWEAVQHQTTTEDKPSEFEQEQFLEYFLNHLPLRKRFIVTQRLRGKKFHEIARSLGTNRETVRLQLREAVEKANSFP